MPIFEGKFICIRSGRLLSSMSGSPLRERSLLELEVCGRVLESIETACLLPPGDILRRWRRDFEFILDRRWDNWLVARKSPRACMGHSIMIIGVTLSRTARLPVQWRQQQERIVLTQLRWQRQVWGAGRV